MKARDSQLLVARNLLQTAKAILASPPVGMSDDCFLNDKSKYTKVHNTGRPRWKDKKGNFYEAFTIFADQADYFIDQGRQGNIIDTNNPVKKEKTFGIFNGAISAVVGALSSLFTSLILNGQMKSIKMEKYAGSYVVDRSFVINGSADMLVDTKVSRHYDPPHHESSSHSSSGGGSSMHTSSSGSSHGGHGGHF